MVYTRAMDTPVLSPPIRILPPQLADQIAAGEVIERPASVLKELMENALDAGATRIDVELITGGMEAVRVSDNGRGIPGEQLPLAISRHATSKISQLDDLLRLQSLGFRGEALASICSVSQWEISTCQAGASRAFAMRYDRPQQVDEINHAAGTSVWIRKLFYNTPARRKFLRAERTEFGHCDDVFRRMALACFDVGFYLKHNSRQVQKLPASSDEVGRDRRIAQLCGQGFIQNSYYLDTAHGSMRLWGWISRPGYSRQQTDMQYFFINGRIIRDRVINHAMRQAYNMYLQPGRHAAYVLHFEIEPASVDVNVHPTKHEVRFRESRMIHDFISRCMRESLQHGEASPATGGGYNHGASEVASHYSMQDTLPGSHERKVGPSASDTHAFFGQLLTIIMGRYLLTQTAEHLYLIDAVRAKTLINLQQWQDAWQSKQVTLRPLLIPARIVLDARQRRRYEQDETMFEKLGFKLEPIGPAELSLRAIPTWLSGYDSPKLILTLLEVGADGAGPFDTIKPFLLEQLCDLQGMDIRQWLRILGQHRELLTDCWRVLTQDDLQHWLSKTAR